MPEINKDYAKPTQLNLDLTPDERAQRVVEILRSDAADREKRDSIYRLIKEMPQE